jgi:hypothetical protein
MNSQNQMNNKHQNIQKNKIKENSKININKPQGSTTYSKNKKSLEKMLREYQTFCKKYFGESTPIGSMTEERMNKLLEDENNIKEKDLLEEKIQFLETLEDNNNNKEEICDQLPIDILYNDNNILGNHKNNKNDYKQRNKIIFNEILKEDKIDNIEYNDFEQNENLEEIKNKKVKLIQKIYRENKYKKKERIYFGYDKEKLNILKIYIDSLDNNGNIIKIDVNNYSIKECKNKYIKINIKDLLNVDFITKDKINDLIDDIILMINNEKPKEKNEKEEDKVLDEDGEEYTF